MMEFPLSNFIPIIICSDIYIYIYSLPLCCLKKLYIVWLKEAFFLTFCVFWSRLERVKRGAVSLLGGLDHPPIEPLVKVQFKVESVCSSPSEVSRCCLWKSSNFYLIDDGLFLFFLCTPSHQKFPSVAFETVPMFIWLTMALSYPLKQDCWVLPLSAPLSFQAIDGVMSIVKLKL